MLASFRFGASKAKKTVTPVEKRERRKAQRQRFSFYMKVQNDETDSTVGHMVDISERGMRMETSAPLPLEKELHLRMELTPDVSDRLFIYFRARTKWIRTDEIMPNMYHVGMQIVDISPHDYEIYQRLQTTYAV